MTYAKKPFQAPRILATASLTELTLLVSGAIFEGPRPRPRPRIRWRWR